LAKFFLGLASLVSVWVELRTLDGLRWDRQCRYIVTLAPNAPDRTVLHELLHIHYNDIEQAHIRKGLRLPGFLGAIRGTRREGREERVLNTLQSWEGAAKVGCIPFPSWILFLGIYFDFLLFLVLGH
jgi:hypothetical protein